MENATDPNDPSRPAIHAIRASLAALLLTFCLSSLAAQSGPALPRSTPEEQGVSSSRLLAFVEAADTQIDAMHSFMLVRHGHVVAEGWWTPYDSETPHVLYSLSKSFTSTAVGLAISEGKLSLDDPVLHFFPGEAPADPSKNLQSMRVRDLLRMAAGNDTEAPLWRGQAEAATPDDPLTKRFLSHPVPFKPGTHFLYNSPATYMLSAIVQKATGLSVLDYLRPRLLDPLGFQDPTWIASDEGISMGAWGFFARTREIARFGQVYLQKGLWHGRQLIPESWVEEATKLQTANGSSPTSDWDQGYGYQFWRSRHNSYRGDGAFGQFCIVVPELDAVVAITSGVGDMQSVMNLVWEMVLPAMQPEPLPDDPISREKLESKLANLRVRLPAGSATSAMEGKVSGKWYEFSENDRGVQAVSLKFSGGAANLSVRTADGLLETPIGLGGWSPRVAGFTNGLDRILGVPKTPQVSGAGAWTTDNVFTVKLVLTETPFYSTLVFRFEGDQLFLDSKQNVAFGPTGLPQLIGKAVSPD